MEGSVTYQRLVREREEGLSEGRSDGQRIEARRLVLRAGAKRFGSAPADAEATLAKIENLETLEGLVERMFEVETWDELLQGLAPSRRRRTPKKAAR